MKWLWITAILGVIGVGFWGAGVYYFEKNESRGIGVWPMMVYSVLLSFIATAFLEFWKRKSASTALNWGTSDISENDVQRPDFRGEEKPGVFVGKIWLDYKDTILPVCKAMKGHESAPDWNPAEQIPTPSNKYYSYSKTKVSRVISYLLLGFMITCVLLINFGVLSFRLFLQKQLPARLSVIGSIVGAVCNKITIGVMGAFWKKVALVTFFSFIP